MMKRVETRRRSFAIAALAALLCANGANAQAAQSSARGGAKAQPKAGAPDNSAADAAAYAKLNAGQVDDAAAAFQAVLAVQPKDAGALAGMGQVRMLQGNYLGAVSFLEQAKQASPNDATIAAALDVARFQFLMGEGKNALAAKDAADAEKRYREAVDLRPDARQAVNALVNVLVEENKLGDAQDALSAAVAHEASANGHPPEELELQLAELDIANNQPQLAYPIFLQVLQANPARVDAWSGLISALHLMGHDADAVAQEKVIPSATRAQLEATPGFRQMMASVANSQTQPVAGETSYTPFVPSAAPAPSPVAAQTAPIAVPPAAAAAATAPATQNAQHAGPTAQHSQAQGGTASGKTSVARSANAQNAPRAIAAATSQSAAPSRPSSSSGSGAPLVTQPAARPANRAEEIPDTGEQQYPQPKTRPRAAQ